MTRQTAWTPDRIRRLRHALGMTQIAFAAALRISPRSEQRWEAQSLSVSHRFPGRRSADALTALEARVLEGPSVFAGFTPKEDPS